MKICRFVPVFLFLTFNKKFLDLYIPDFSLTCFLLEESIWQMSKYSSSIFKEVLRCPQ